MAAAEAHPKRWSGVGGQTPTSIDLPSENDASSIVSKM